MQRLLNSAVWDADLVRDDLCTYILEQLGDPKAILVIDAHERSQTRYKIGRSRHGALRHNWPDGKLSGRGFLAYSDSKGHTLLDREMYLFVGKEPIPHNFYAPIASRSKK